MPDLRYIANHSVSRAPLAPCQALPSLVPQVFLVASVGRQRSNILTLHVVNVWLQLLISKYLPYSLLTHESYVIESQSSLTVTELN